MVGNIACLLSALLMFFGETFAFDDFALCDKQINLYPGQSRSLRQPNWPAGYMPKSSCRYNIRAPTDYQIQVSCVIDMKDSGNCGTEKFYISDDGNKNISSVQPVCGTKALPKTTSIRNELTLAYTSDYYSGVFDCTLTAVCDCGWGLNSRIVGGTETLPNEFPSSAALISTKYKALYCGATIVSSRYVSTAAHCLRKTPHYQSAVLVGDHDLTTGTDTQEADLYPILRFIEHPGYNNVTNLNDIGLVQTWYAMIWSRGVGPVCLPFYYPDADFSGLDVIATGWGTTEFGGRMSNYLQKVDLTVLKNSDTACISSYPSVAASQMCTYKEDKDTCQYDSGGGLLYSGWTGSRNFLIGQVSLGEGCAGSVPSLNTRITQFMGWIEQNTGSLCRHTIH